MTLIGGRISVAVLVAVLAFTAGRITAPQPKPPEWDIAVKRGTLKCDRKTRALWVSDWTFYGSASDSVSLYYDGQTAKWLNKIPLEELF